MQLTYKAPCAELLKLENLWLQLSRISCNIKCKHCYLDCHQDTKKRNFLPVQKIISTLNITPKSLKMIYITGGEPFLHPQINEIIKLCLKKSDITIYTNGTLVNEKKIKILKTLENESQHKIHFKFSLDHYMEGKNDEYRAPGVYKKVINALKLAQKYDFQAGITCVNIKHEAEPTLRDGFLSLFKKQELNLSEKDLKIVPLLNMGNYAKYYNMTQTPQHVSFSDIENFDLEKLDCKNSRVLTNDGIYSCPALVNDPRGKLGNELNNSDTKVYLETQTCYDCVSRNEKLFG